MQGDARKVAYQLQTNILAEQTIRAVVRVRNNTQGTRSEWGQIWNSRIFSVLATYHQPSSKFRLPKGLCCNVDTADQLLTGSELIFLSLTTMFSDEPLLFWPFTRADQRRQIITCHTTSNFLHNIKTLGNFMKSFLGAGF